ncbi:bifunctional riboflavin kinase/FAD synthetase [Cyanobacterium sp. Dongsha4]|uniref:bifunctional riboflavin kinase/FAD synthetase n=1 Tax=Cyanobacterium sp. DS4 TaxID=2878255 RepID=UPI002E81EE85|nr:bifunctional riboflavin kinase/FAD synthetase [Cyanobacterium sp. Dongsha4]WVL02474.1 bifunctional riboflavin kinase/FAD synthetase [Cyanobacterium sp. Dongsha4]
MITYNSPVAIEQNSLQNIHRAIALGNFDGVHLGHQEVIKPILKGNIAKNLVPALVTFIPHPQEFFSGQTKKLLTPIKEKAQILDKLGIQELILLPFDRELANLTPLEFVKEVLLEKIKANFVSVGEDFCFGYKRQGKAKDLQSLANQYQIEVNITPEQHFLVNQQNIRISSSYIRQSLSEGKVELAKDMLGRNYQIQGKVVEGQKLGRELGFPTANLKIPPEKYLPKQGVYGVKVDIPQQQKYDLSAVMNVGKRPTVGGESIIVEVHLLNWQGDLYGQDLVIKLVNFIRPEKKFTSLDELKNQITLDCQLCL